MGKRLVLPTLAVLAVLCFPGNFREAAAQVPDVLWETTFTVRDLPSLSAVSATGCDNFTNSNPACSATAQLSDDDFEYGSPTVT